MLKYEKIIVLYTYEKKAKHFKVECLSQKTILNSNIFQALCIYMEQKITRITVNERPLQVYTR